MDHILEQEQRLSQSVLWKLQETAYLQFGIGAWGEQGVPSYITSNPYTARSYAHVVLGFLKDMLNNGKIDKSYPVYILDLGAGSGRFAFLFLKELMGLLEGTRLAALKIRYVMTDIVESNLAFLQQHSHLKPYFKKGIADTAYFHHAQTEPLRLTDSGNILDKATLVNPLIAIGNYFFDTIPQDLFRVNHGKLEEGKVTLSVEGSAFTSISDPAIINHLHCTYSYHPVSCANYYEDVDIDAVLAAYQNTFDGGTFLFPIGALQTIRRLSQQANGRLFFISGDQGVCTAEQVRNWGEPSLSIHGSFSIAVSYHAIAQFVQQCGGQALLSTLSEPSFVVMVGLLTDESVGSDYFCETTQAFAGTIDSFEPRDYWRLISLAQEQQGKLSLEYLLLLIKLGNWDPMTFHAFFPILRQAIADATAAHKQLLSLIIERVWENFYPITQAEGDFVLNLGVLCFELKDYLSAIKYFERSMAISGVNERALNNIAACKARLAVV